ncbi:hypothetical protein Airi02_063010 [Actinoallomurus iriomotensis]|uniref:Uncharacterized protein n=1 Tax=Actinoallomurus iriomotensis TaxID=478107 RepID=A0A9W6W2Z1_9ACTN|nr:hypothetical protein Airi02_063010 [Actinoallomurus iriomotensis]
MSAGPSAVDGGPLAFGVIVWSDGVRTTEKHRANPFFGVALHPAGVSTVSGAVADAGEPAGDAYPAPPDSSANITTVAPMTASRERRALLSTDTGRLGVCMVECLSATDQWRLPSGGSGGEGLEGFELVVIDGRVDGVVIRFGGGILGWFSHAANIRREGGHRRLGKSPNLRAGHPPATG